MSGVIPTQYPDGELPVSEGGLQAAAIAHGEFDLSFVAAIVPLVNEVVAWAGTAEASPEPKCPGPHFDGDVVRCDCR